MIDEMFSPENLEARGLTAVYKIAHEMSYYIKAYEAACRLAEITGLDPEKTFARYAEKQGVDAELMYERAREWWDAAAQVLHDHLCPCAQKHTTTVRYDA